MGNGFVLSASRESAPGSGRFSQRTLRPPLDSKRKDRYFHFIPVDHTRQVRMGSQHVPGTWTIDGGAVIDRPFELVVSEYKPGYAIALPQVREALEGKDLSVSCLLVEINKSDGLYGKSTETRAIGPGETTSFEIGETVDGKKVRINVTA